MLKIDRTTSTPEILLDGSIFKMTGVCTPEHPPRFFQQFEEKLKELYTSGKELELTFHLDYFNTGSSKCLLNLFRDLAGQKAKVKVTWIYEKGDDEMRESGELYAEIAEMDFNLIER